MSAPQPTPAQRLVGDLSPKLAEVSDHVLAADIWQRPELSGRDRSMITIAALIMVGNTTELAIHLRRGLVNGLTRDEIGEMVLHLAFYAGWPHALSAAAVARSVFTTDSSE